MPLLMEEASAASKSMAERAGAMSDMLDRYRFGAEAGAEIAARRVA